MTPHEMRELKARGMTFQAISEIAGVSKSCVVKHVKMEVAAPRPKAKEIRKCLCCGHDFKSFGSHNRMCEKCKRRSATVSPFAPHLPDSKDSR